MLHSARSSLLILGLVAAAILSAHAPSATAGVAYTVDSTADATDANPGDGNCATAQNECTLRAAIQEANATPGFASVSVPSGTFTLSIAGANEDNAATGDLDITDTLHIEGAGMDATTIDGGGIDRVFNTFSATEILDLTIQHGNADDPNTGEGGGIYNRGQLEILRARITLNSTFYMGGGVSSRGDGASVSIQESVIDANSSVEDSAGIEAQEELSILDSTISNNIAGRWSAGVVVSDGSLTMTNSTVSGNASTLGGGVHITGESTGEITNSTIVNNEGGSNGGLRVTGASVLTIANSLVVNNSGDNCLTDASNQSSITDSGHNHSSDGTCDFEANGGADNVNPVIGPLADNGGLTMTHALLQGSPAKDDGDNALCPPFDQRGVARPQGPHCDVGAYEATGDEPQPDRIWGDNNCSGEADPIDSLLTLRFDAGLSTDTGDCPGMGEVVEVANASPHPWGDIDCGGDVNPVDSLKLLRFDAGLDVAQAAGCPGLGSTVVVSD